ncbi:MarR family winged helix-turn-helix transcriptional regulator [Amycolatopsis jiangsuensis]|uniref:DNA-binding MarR family transcriptional regulator n=1 Tax=Amycolatopsis jiangsuensis TaxID=1181879 RepID=A0A840IQ73_9PSEU|nr:MarR family transcriptional regulator [Amycolatopsis jiangsuensis]MBB4683184.1 DNA-binding MarR family transcriptional regulator [Amycolatopsis jiangsuensis]
MSGPRWLTDQEQQVWRAYANATAMLQAHLEGQLQHESGMPHTYYEVLVSLSEAPGRRLRMSELAAARGSSRSRLSHAVARLEAKGWVTRESCPTDKRGSWAVLTGEGLAALEAAAPGHVAAVREGLLDPLTPEQVRQLGEISTAILGALQPRCAAAVAAEETAEEEVGWGAGDGSGPDAGCPAGDAELPRSG